MIRKKRNKEMQKSYYELGINNMGGSNLKFEQKLRKSLQRI